MSRSGESKNNWDFREGEPKFEAFSAQNLQQEAFVTLLHDSLHYYRTLPHGSDRKAVIDCDVDFVRRQYSPAYFIGETVFAAVELHQS